MTLLVLLMSLCMSYILSGQEQIIINLGDSSIFIDNVKKYDYVEMDSTYTFHHYGIWGSEESRADTFFYVSKKIIRKKNKTSISPTIHRKNKELIGKSQEEQDSILNKSLQYEYRWRVYGSYPRISYKVTPIKYYKRKYRYIEIYSTYYRRIKTKKYYTSKATRIFLFGELRYHIIISSNASTATSILKSRKAVCCDFKRLVNNITIIEKEEPSPSK